MHTGELQAIHQGIDTVHQGLGPAYKGVVLLYRKLGNQLGA